MTPSAIVMMIVAVCVIWGGLLTSILHAVHHS